jgi:hypothetical protein
MPWAGHETRMKVMENALNIMENRKGLERLGYLVTNVG